MRLLFWTRGVRGKCAHGTTRCRTLPLLIALLLVVVQGFPAVLRHEGNLSTSEISQAVVFLTRYGYLPPSDPNTGNLRSESEFRGAIAAMQRFGGLPPTGRIDRDTVAMMGARRCGVPDFFSPEDDMYRVRRYAIQGQKWPSTNLTWSVKSDASSSDAMPMVRAQLRRAFSVWSEASALTFAEVSGGRARSADILVSFLKGPHGDGYPFDGEGSVLAHAFFPGEGIGGDAHFDAEERWLPSEPQDDDGVNLFAVAAHEIGHSLGLSHSSTPGSLMFPYYQVLDERFQLPVDDAEGIRHLYGTRSSEPTMPTLAPTTPTVLTTTRKARVVPSKKTTATPEAPRTTTSGPPPPAAPDICNSSVDAISLIRREIFAFKGNYFWRLHANRTLRAGYPVSIDRFWYDLSPNVTRIDALYERPKDTKIVFFAGKEYWLFSANQLEPGYPKPLTDLGLTDDVDHIDAAMVWGHNGKTYLFSGMQYWKLDEDEGRVELDYPRSITAWRGIPHGIDAAFQWTDGNTYFFKNNKFWKFVDIKMRVEKKSPSEIGGFWFQCPSKTIESTTTFTSVLDPRVQQSSVADNSVTFHTMPYLCLLILICFVV